MWFSNLNQSLKGMRKLHPFHSYSYTGEGNKNEYKSHPHVLEDQKLTQSSLQREPELHRFLPRQKSRMGQEWWTLFSVFSVQEITLRCCSSELKKDWKGFARVSEGIFSSAVEPHHFVAKDRPWCPSFSPEWPIILDITFHRSSRDTFFFMSYLLQGLFAHFWFSLSLRCAMLCTKGQPDPSPGTT